MEKFSYRLTSLQKEEVAQNLISILESDAEATKETRCFIANWVMTGPNEKRKAFYDVWDIVLKNYLPQTKPVLFRACSRPVDGKISSFTGRFECAEEFSKYKGILLICDTAFSLLIDSRHNKPGSYRNSFYPLADAIKRINMGKPDDDIGFLKRYIGEDEYIMRVNLGLMSKLKWCKEKAE